MTKANCALFSVANCDPDLKLAADAPLESLQENLGQITSGIFSALTSDGGGW